jgi:hypothetical protein
VNHSYPHPANRTGDYKLNVHDEATMPKNMYFWKLFIPFISSFSYHKQISIVTIFIDTGFIGI